MRGELIIVALGYLAGSLPTALLVVRAATGGDVRTSGSGNVGATNAARLAGLRVGALVTVVDMVKGALPVLVMEWYNPAAVWVGTVLLASVLGHCYPVWLRFRGGKGVATVFGALVVVSPLTTLAAAGIWVVVLLAFRFVSLASMLAAASFPVLLVWMGSPAVAMVWMVTAAVVLIVLRHVSNIRNILNGDEIRLGVGEGDE